MPYFKDLQSKVHFLSEEQFFFQERLPENSVLISEQEAQMLLVNGTLPKTYDVLLQALNFEYEAKMAEIASLYPSTERESWPVQILEALSLVNNEAMPTPWIDNAADIRNISREYLASRIVEKDMAYRVISGRMTGTRHLLEQQILDAQDNPEVLQQIDIYNGWPSYD